MHGRGLSVRALAVGGANGLLGLSLVRLEELLQLLCTGEVFVDLRTDYVFALVALLVCSSQVREVQSELDQTRAAVERKGERKRGHERKAIHLRAVMK